MPNESITTYLPKDLAERVAEARSAGTLDPKEVIKNALQAALDPSSSPPAGPQGDEPVVEPVAGVDDGLAYELVWAENAPEFQARLDLITTAGGKPISVAIDAQDRFCLLI